MKVALHKIIEPNIDEIPRDWANFWVKMLMLVHNQNMQLKVKANDPLSASKHFLSNKINSVEWYDKKGNKQTFTNFHEVPARDEVSRVVAKIKHIELEYIPASEGKPECFTASGCQYDLNSDDFEEANNAMMEKALSAISLVTITQADGENEINFDQTDDPIDRYMLMMACDLLEISYGEEDIYASSVPGVEVKTGHEYLSSPYVQATVNEIKKKKGNPDDADLVVTAAQIAFNSYLESQPPIFPKNRQHQDTASLYPDSTSNNITPLRPSAKTTPELVQGALGHDF